MPVRQRDGLFHQPLFGEPSWLETNWFSFTVPQANIRCHLYTGFRTNLQVVFSSIMIWSRDCESHLDFDHYDSRVHLPFPSGNLDHYRLDNGLEVHMVEPLSEWNVSYRGVNGTAIDLNLKALMPALDSRETTVPGGRDFSHFHSVKSMAHDEVGHIDQTLMATGTVRVGGRSYEFAEPTNRDHSWSPRPEHGHGRGNFDEAYFGPDLAFHVQTIETAPGTHSVSNGYILDKGRVLTLKAGSGHVAPSGGWRLASIRYELEDESGRSHVLTGEPVTATPLPTWPNQFEHGRPDQVALRGRRRTG